jgi:hypothetical protein
MVVVFILEREVADWGELVPAVCVTFLVDGPLHNRELVLGLIDLDAL